MNCYSLTSELVRSRATATSMTPTGCPVSHNACTCYYMAELQRTNGFTHSWPYTAAMCELTHSVERMRQISIALLRNPTGDTSLDKRHWEELGTVPIVNKITLSTTANHTAADVIL